MKTQLHIYNITQEAEKLAMNLTSSLAEMDDNR